jgi:16S rRNA (uracil1498-N3)-methyltransferase
MPRFFVPTTLTAGAPLDLPAGPARHVQVLRMQPGETITLFNGETDGEFDATIAHMGRSDVQVLLGAHHATQREPARAVHLVLGMPANDRMDWLVEKAGELGVASIQPLMTERSVLRLSGERAEKKVAHWRSVAVSACEQCGGNRVPRVHAVQTLDAWLKAQAATNDPTRLLLSLQDGAVPLRNWVGVNAAHPATFLSGPEGGLSAQEEAAALASGFKPVTLGPRVLRAETAAIAALMAILV